MITGLAIENFKLYRQRTVFDGLKPINVLTGINGRGKSTLLHALLLPKQSLMESQWNNKLVLNGQYVELGNAIDVRNDKNSREKPIAFGYTTEKGGLELLFDANSDTAQKLPLVAVNEKAVADGTRLTNFVTEEVGAANPGLFRLLRGVSYIAAERKGPQLNYEPAPEQGQMDAKGEYAPSLLHLHKNDTFNEEMLAGMTDIFPEVEVDDIQDRSLNGMVNFWLTRMFDFTEVEAKYVEEANVYVLFISTSLKKKASKPTNVGFGYSYVLPILVAGLTATEGDLLIVENPEAHLHPRAQSVLGKFMSWIARYKGVQLFVETHSEHIVNSFRVLVAQETLTPDDVNILFFDEHYEHFAERIEVDKKGHIRDWPEYFFDQEERDLDIIV